MEKQKVYFGYMRVSTLEQNVDRQKIALEKFASENKIKFKKIFEDFATGTNLNRPQLNLLLDQLREDDVIVCESYDRLCRSTLDLLSLMKNFEDKNVDFISIKENFSTSNAMEKLMLTMIAGLGEMERTLMLERQAIGIQKASAEGKYKGRKPNRKTDNFDECYKKYAECSRFNKYTFKQGGTHFHVFICLSERKKKTLEQLQTHFKVENEFVTATPYIQQVQGKDWDYAVRYTVKEDKTPFCSLGSARLLTYLNNLNSKNVTENYDIKNIIKDIINESEFLKPDDVKSKADLRSEVFDIDIDPSMKIVKEEKIKIKKLETESLLLNSLSPGSYHFNSSNPIAIKYLVNLIKNHYSSNFITRLSPFLTPTREAMENVLSKLTNKGGSNNIRLSSYTGKSSTDVIVINGNKSLS